MDDIFSLVRDGNALQVRIWLDNTENDLNQGSVQTVLYKFLFSLHCRILSHFVGVTKCGTTEFYWSRLKAVCGGHKLHFKTFLANTILKTYILKLKSNIMQLVDHEAMFYVITKFYFHYLMQTLYVSRFNFMHLFMFVHIVHVLLFEKSFANPNHKTFCS